MRTSNRMASDYSLIIHSYLLTLGYPTNQQGMCAELARKTGLDHGFCHHLLSAGGNLQLVELEHFCQSLNISLVELLTLGGSRSAVEPTCARNVYTASKVFFYVSEAHPFHSDADLLWLNSLSFEKQIRLSDTVIFSGDEPSKFSQGELYVACYEDEYQICRCIKTNAFYSNFQMSDGHTQLVRMHSTDNNNASNIDFKMHQILLSYCTYFGAA